MYGGTGSTAPPERPQGRQRCCCALAPLSRPQRAIPVLRGPYMKQSGRYMHELRAYAANIAEQLINYGTLTICPQALLATTRPPETRYRNGVGGEH
ncbi:hypothetical protein FRAHR75_10144 [Frankia sp. Hr75.2]|nr:hypothetical protein FRAHR75_10144 [Frankia sp. Hr75.2]SQE00013.1 hypothetical protein FMEAI12_6040011 [Parafrankia sp. Ea1.12]